MENPFVIAMNCSDFELKDIQIAWYYYTIGTRKNNPEILIAFFISLSCVFQTTSQQGAPKYKIL